MCLDCLFCIRSMAESDEQDCIFSDSDGKSAKLTIFIVLKKFIQKFIRGISHTKNESIIK